LRVSRFTELDAMDSINFSNFLSSILSEPIRVIDPSISLHEYIHIDLSSKNEDLTSFDISSSENWEKYIELYLKENNAKVAFGGYLERRAIYSRSSHFNQNNSENERNIHLGIDLWCKKDTEVLAVLDGEIHSFKNNTNFGDYGPTIILKHSIDSLEFYSLYGHLTTASIENIKVGDKVTKREIIGHLGNSIINGDYAPHLHFQLIKDLQSNFGDYPGVCSKKELEFYRENCPNPNLLLKL